MTASASSSLLDTPAWLENRLTKFDLQVHDFYQTGRGLQTTRDRSPGEVLLRVPQTDAVTVSSLLERYPLLSHAADKSLHDFKSPLTDEQILAVGLLWLRHDRDPYALSLPEKQHSVLQMPHELLTLLFPTAYQKLIQAYQRHVLFLYGSVLPALDIDNNTTTTCTENDTDTDDDKAVTLPMKITEQDFLWAFCTVRSRCVGMDGAEDPRIRTGAQDDDEIRVMLPGFDLLNHKFGAQSTPTREDNDNDSGGDYVITSQDAYRAMEQVFISYSDQRTNLKLLLTYGFCLPDNPNRVVLFDYADVLSACGRARPQYFTPPILDQLWHLLAKLGQQRALMTWQDGQPHESLQKGMAMMAQLLEQQFLTTTTGRDEKDETFAHDLLQALLANRKEEVEQCMQQSIRQQQQQQQTPDDDDDDNNNNDQGRPTAVVHPEWIPLVNSIQVLLKDELQYLSDDNNNKDGANMQ